MACPDFRLNHEQAPCTTELRDWFRKARLNQNRLSRRSRFAEIPATLRRVATETDVNAAIEAGSKIRSGGTVFRILVAISFCHLLNDMLQSVIPAVYPILKASYHLDFGQVGLIALTSQLTASLLQPLVGMFTDHRPTPYSLPAGMTFTMAGLILLASAPSLGMVLVAVA